MGTMKASNTVQRFSYDAQGKVVAVDYSTNGGSSYTTYYYLRNAQGDIVKLIDGSGNTVVEYTYDSWGKILAVTGSLATSLGANQPFRYRGYVYDNETGWHYLQSRYYNPNSCRFISSDVLLSTGQGVIGHNSYAYCLNNPVNLEDQSGAAAHFNCTVVVCDGYSSNNNSGSIVLIDGLESEPERYTALYNAYKAEFDSKDKRVLVSANVQKVGRDNYDAEWDKWADIGSAAVGIGLDALSYVLGGFSLAIVNSILAAGSFALLFVNYDSASTGTYDYYYINLVICEKCSITGEWIRNEYTYYSFWYDAYDGAERWYTE